MNKLSGFFVVCALTGAFHLQSMEKEPKQKSGGSLVSPLHVAVAMGDKQKVEQLLAAGTPINGQSRNTKMTALHAAVCNGHYDLVKMLLSNGANWRLEKKHYGAWLNCAEMAARCNRDWRIVELFLAPEQGMRGKDFIRLMTFSSPCQWEIFEKLKNKKYDNKHFLEVLYVIGPMNGNETTEAIFKWAGDNLTAELGRCQDEDRHCLLLRITHAISDRTDVETSEYQIFLTAIFSYVSEELLFFEDGLLFRHIIQLGNEAMLNHLFQSEAVSDIHTINDGIGLGFSPLTYCARASSSYAMRRCLEKRCSTSKADAKNRTPWSEALRSLDDAVQNYGDSTNGKDVRGALQCVEILAQAMPEKEVPEKWKTYFQKDADTPAWLKKLRELDYSTATGTKRIRSPSD